MFQILTAVEGNLQLDREPHYFRRWTICTLSDASEEPEE